MRLTTSGFVFLGIGAVAFGAAYFMNIPPLRAVGMLMVVLPLLSLLTVLGSGGSLAVERVRFDCPGDRSTPEEGALSPLRFTARNTGAGTSPPVSLRVFAADALGLESTLTVPPLAPNGEASFELPCRPTVRGTHALGPFIARRRGTLGLARRTVECLPVREVAVGPRMFNVPELMKLARSHGGHDLRRITHGFGVRDFTTRAYERGDDIRRVHWGSTAKHGELMVRGEAGSEAPIAAVVLDTYEAGYPRRKYFEWSVCAAAAATWAMLRAGYDVDLITGTGPATHFTAGDGPPATLDSCLTAFATVTPGGAASQGVAVPQGGAKAGGTGTRGSVPTGAGIVVAVTGSSARGAAKLFGLAGDGGSALRVAICHDEQLLGSLAEHRFLAAAVDPRTTSVADAWAQVLQVAGR